MHTTQDIGVGAAGNLIGNFAGIAIIRLIQHLKDVVASEENLQFLTTELTRMENTVKNIRLQFEDQRKTIPALVQSSLESMKTHLDEVKEFIDSAEKERKQCLERCGLFCTSTLHCGLFCSPKLPAKIREWRENRFENLSQQLQSDLSIAASTAQIVERVPPQAVRLLQPIHESRFVGSGIFESVEQVSTWLNDPSHPAQVIGVYGMRGVGKTSLLQLIYNKFCGNKVSSKFDVVIWFTVSKDYKIESLQDTIAESLDLNFKTIPSIDHRMMRLYNYLESRSFLLILDDLWDPIDLNKVGVNFGQNSSSRVLISSHNIDVIEKMEAYAYSMKIQPLSTENGWELFRRTAFRDIAIVPDSLLDIARQIASECKGLPLAIITVAAALAWKNSVDDWNSALDLMRNVDHAFRFIYGSIDTELYGRLRLSYDYLPNQISKKCFLYCAAFPEDAIIRVETLVEMWSAEQLVTVQGKYYFMNVGRGYIELLVHRCLIEYADPEKVDVDEGEDYGDGKKMYIKVHDVLRDMAIHTGREEENGLFLAGQHLKDFPREDQTKDRKIITVFKNEISDLPADFRCPTLRTLVLAENIQLKKIPERFLETCSMSLKVLDLSCTSIQALPTSVGKLVELEFLNLRGCNSLTDLPDSICNLSRLQFLNLEDCSSLKYSLPDRIGELQNLKHLKFSGGEVQRIPHQIFQLTSLNKLVFPTLSPPMSLEDLTNLSNLIELEVKVNPEIKGGSVVTWSEMRNLKLYFGHSLVEEENRDDAALHVVPQSMQCMKHLQSLYFNNYIGVSLPICICEFKHLKNLYLDTCPKLKEFPTMEIAAASPGFPMLERLRLFSLGSLANIVWNERSMLNLQKLNILDCPMLKTFRMEKLPKLRDATISSCTELKELYIGSGGFPMLEALKLEHLSRLESVAVPSSLWSEKTMPKLQVLHIEGCLLFRKLSMDKLPNLKEITISHCPVLEVDIDNLPMLETLTLESLEKLAHIAKPSGVWNEKTMPNLQCLSIINCPLLRSLPLEMDKLPNLKEIVGKLDWWEKIIWQSRDVKIKLSRLFKEAT